MASEGAPIDVDEADPIKATYEVFIKPQMQNGQQLYILQFPNRPANEDYSSKNHALPLEVRLKPKTKLVEVDVPLDVWQNYDREKGARWGESMRKSNAKNAGTAGGGHSQGLAGGFGIGGQTAPPRRRAADDGDVMAESQIMKEFPMGVTQQRVLTKQTLGGQAIPREAATPQYFIGAFRKNQLHLTPVNEMAQMRPQFHHIDAHTEQERASRPRDPNFVRAPAEARAVHMTVKSTVESEDTEETIAERIKAAQDEPWKKMKYVDEDSEVAWEKFNEELFVEDTEKAERLVSVYGDEEYLDRISAPRDQARLSRARVRRKKNRGGDGESDEE